MNETITDRPSTTAEQKCLQERCVNTKEACRYRMFPSDIATFSTQVITDILTALLIHMRTHIYATAEAEEFKCVCMYVK